MAGYVRVTREDSRRLAKHLGLSLAAFERKHVKEVTAEKEKLIKEGYKTCQFLGENRRCTVYEARPQVCRGYVCWNQADETVYNFAAFLQNGVGGLREREG